MMVRRALPFAVVFVAGFAAGGLVRVGAPRAGDAADMAADPASVGDLGAYAGEVLRVIDGDTVEARVNVWLGHQIVTHVRLRGVDAPELNAACAEERTRALAAREALAAFAAGRRVTFSAVGPDKYFGRVVASLADEGGRDAAATLVAQGHVRRYDGRARRGWCG